MSETTKTVHPLRGMRGMIAGKMQQSLQQHAQLSYFAEFDATALQRARLAYKEKGIKVGYEDLFITALVPTLQQHPNVNGRISEKEVEIDSAIHVSVAVSLDAGLVAPTIFDTQDKTVVEVAEARRDLMQRAQNNKLTVPEMTGGTVTISNLGVTPVQYFTPIINTPQLAIIGIGCIQQKPVPDDQGNIVFKPFIGLSLTADHRWIDGAPAGFFLESLCAQLEAISAT